MRKAVGTLVTAFVGVVGLSAGYAQAAPVLKTTGFLRFTPATAPFDSGANYFDPANGFVPSYTSNSAGKTVPVNNNIEFGYDDGVNTDTVDFVNGTSLLINDLSKNGAMPFRFTVYVNRNNFFSNAMFVLNDFDAILKVNAAGNGLTFISRNLIPSGSSNRTALITFSGSGAVPEPVTWAMMVIGFGAVGAAMRSSRSRSVLQAA